MVFIHRLGNSFRILFEKREIHELREVINKRIYHLPRSTKWKIEGMALICDPYYVPIRAAERRFFLIGSIDRES